MHDLPSQETIIGKFLNDMTIDPLRNWHCQAKANSFQLLWMEQKSPNMIGFRAGQFDLILNALHDEGANLAEAHLSMIVL